MVAPNVDDAPLSHEPAHPGFGEAVSRLFPGYTGGPPDKCGPTAHRVLHQLFELLTLVKSVGTAEYCCR